MWTFKATIHDQGNFSILIFEFSIKIFNPFIEKSSIHQAFSLSVIAES